MIRSFTVTAGLALLLLLTNGCVYALRPYNALSQEKLQIGAAGSTNYVVTVQDQVFPVGADGRVVVDVPRLPRGCKVLVFGIVKVSDGDPQKLRAIQVVKNGKVVRKLSLEQIGKLPVDAEGYRRVDL